MQRDQIQVKVALITNLQRIGRPLVLLQSREISLLLGFYWTENPQAACPNNLYATHSYYHDCLSNHCSLDLHRE